MVKAPDVCQDLGPAPLGFTHGGRSEPLSGTHHIREEVSVAEFLQVQQVGSRRRVEFLRRQTVQNRLHDVRQSVRLSSDRWTDL